MSNYYYYYALCRMWLSHRSKNDLADAPLATNGYNIMVEVDFEFWCEIYNQSKSKWYNNIRVFAFTRMTLLYIPIQICSSFFLLISMLAAWMLYVNLNDRIACVTAYYKPCSRRWSNGAYKNPLHLLDWHQSVCKRSLE